LLQFHSCFTDVNRQSVELVVDTRHAPPAHPRDGTVRMITHAAAAAAMLPPMLLPPRFKRKAASQYAMPA
jgi:hypothetical protein